MAALLRQGSSGPEVTRVQQALNRAGGSSLPKLVEDGIFGLKTRARVVEFQRSRGLVADGIVGPKTRAALSLAEGPPGAGGEGSAVDVPKAIGDVGPIVTGVVGATRTAHLGAWKPQARFQGILINGPSAIGGPGCLTGPDLGGLILSQPQIATLKGDDRSVAEAAAKGIGARFSAWQGAVIVPGLPWYPTFAAFPAPFAPPTPNVPAPLVALPSAGTGGLTNPTSLQGAMSSHLDAQVKARAKNHLQVFGLIAGQVASYFAGWLASQLVVNVLGQGPVPTFAPPFVPVGPVVGGSTLPGGGHLP